MKKFLAIFALLLGAATVSYSGEWNGAGGGSASFINGQSIQGKNATFETLQSTGTAPSLTATGAVFTGSVTVTGSNGLSVGGNVGLAGYATPQHPIDFGATTTGKKVCIRSDNTNGNNCYGLGFHSSGFTQLWASDVLGLSMAYNGSVGINTTETEFPLGRLNVKQKAGDNYILAVTSASSAYNWVVDKFGHIVSSGAAPAIGTCTNGAILQGSTDVSGRVNFTGANSSCSITFAYAAQPAQTVNCAVSTNMATPALYNVTATGTTLTVVANAFANTDYFTYVCYRNGGTY